MPNIKRANASGITKPGTAIADVPDAPTIGTATGGQASATVTYTAAATGGTATTFTATSTPGSITGTGASPITISGLTNGTAYSFTVTASNSTGTSPASSASNQVTPISLGDMDPIGMVQVGSAGAATITFSSIPATYTHLQIRALVTGTNATQTGSTSFQLNGDTGANYTRHQLGGGGATAFAYAATAETKGHIYGYNDNLNNVVPMSFVMDILDYANTSKYKTTRVLSGSDRNGTSPHGDINLVSSLWLNTNAITSLSIFIGGQNVGQYSSFALYGIKGA